MVLSYNEIRGLNRDFMFIGVTENSRFAIIRNNKTGMKFQRKIRNSREGAYIIFDRRKLYLE